MSSQPRTTAGQHGISGSAIKSTPVPLPPEREARRIALAVREALGVIQETTIGATRGFSDAGRLRQSILSAAFSGRLVPQDPDDEPASRLLERLRAEHEAAPKRRRGRARKAPQELPA